MRATFSKIAASVACFQKASGRHGPLFFTKLNSARGESRGHTRLPVVLLVNSRLRNIACAAARVYCPRVWPVPRRAVTRARCAVAPLSGACGTSSPSACARPDPAEDQDDTSEKEGTAEAIAWGPQNDQDDTDLGALHVAATGNRRRLARRRTDALYENVSAASNTYDNVDHRTSRIAAIRSRLSRALAAKED